MSISISSLLPPTPFAPANTASSAVQNAPQPPPPPRQAEDTIQLTQAEQVYQLYNQGQRVTQIANSLSLPVAAVNNYLGITNSNSQG
ncbi:MAG TPA: hypothetical protein VND65_05755 [Candidatus Binatia bacterium]|nr:hypothetical protein [Candidatus Binatia bacterium]